MAEVIVCAQAKSNDEPDFLLKNSSLEVTEEKEISSIIDDFKELSDNGKLISDLSKYKAKKKGRRFYLKLPTATKDDGQRALSIEVLIKDFSAGDRDLILSSLKSSISTIGYDMRGLDLQEIVNFLYNEKKKQMRIFAIATCTAIAVAVGAYLIYNTKN